MKQQLIAIIESLSALTLTLVQRVGADGKPIIGWDERGEILGPLNEVKRELEYKPVKFDNSKFIKAIKNAKGKQPLELISAECGVSKTTLSRIINGHTPEMETLANICNWINMSPGEFFTETVSAKITLTSCLIEAE